MGYNPIQNNIKLWHFN